MGFGAMQLGGRNAFGPAADPERSRQALRTAVDLGVRHVDTSDYYGPYLVNDLIRESLAPYPPELVLVTKVGARRTDAGAWLPWFEPDDIKEAVHAAAPRIVDAPGYEMPADSAAAGTSIMPPTGMCSATGSPRLASSWRAWASSSMASSTSWGCVSIGSRICRLPWTEARRSARSCTRNISGSARL